MDLRDGLRRSIQPQKWVISPFSAGDYSFDAFKAYETLVDANRPILQLNTFPMTIDPSDFANPFGPNNPNGSYTTLYSFYQLVDPIPSFTKNYWPTNNSTDRTYGNLLNLATAARSGTPAITILSDAKKRYDISELSDMAGTGINFHATYAVPYNWYELYDDYSEIEIDLTDPKALEECGFAILGGDDTEMKWNIGNSRDPKSQKLLEMNTAIEQIKFKYCMVAIQRPWLDFQLFNIPGWKIQGLSRAYYSTGTLTNNNGVLPLLPTGIIIGRDIQITAQWSEADRRIIEKAETGSQMVSFGQFALSGFISGSQAKTFASKLDNNTISVPALHVVGWVSSLVPLSPQDG